MPLLSPAADLDARHRAWCGELYRDDPVGYAEAALGVDLTPQQQDIARALRRPPYKVCVPASTAVGKSFLAAVLASWWFDTFDDSQVITTGPTQATVKDCIWKELRSVRGRAGLDDFAGPESIRMKAGSRRAIGIVSRTPTAFQGRHAQHSLIVFDEATAIESTWDRALPMMQGDAYAFLAIGNPTTAACRFFTECESGDWTVLPLSGIDHPNIAAELAGKDPPFPSAVRLATFDAMLRKWSSPVAVGDQQPTDVEWPPRSGRWLRPGPEAEGLLLGRWPSQAVNAVWGPATWTACLAERGLDGELTIGLDVARFGDDKTCCVTRQGAVVLEALERSGLSTLRSAELALDAAERWAAKFPETRPQDASIGPPRGNLHPKRVDIRTDDAGVGGGVTDQIRARGYRCTPCLGAHAAKDQRLYPNRRSESWFELAEAAMAGRVSFARLPRDVQAELKNQLLGVTYTLDTRGRRVVEPKDRTKARLKKSPDLADAVMLAFCDPPAFTVHRLV